MRIEPPRAPRPPSGGATAPPTTRIAPRYRLRVVLLEDEAEAARALTGMTEARASPRDKLLDAMALEAVERLVCKLYGLPDALTEPVVESAVTRAGTVAQAEG